MRLLLTANTAWNILHFRRGLVQALREDGHQVTVLAPQDGTEHELQEMGCRFRTLTMNSKGLNPLEDMRLVGRFRRFMAGMQPDAALSFTIKNNIYGALAAKRQGIPFIPNVTGLGTAFLSGGPLQTVAEQLYTRAFRQLPVVFFQNRDDRSLFLDRGLVTPSQARLLPGSGIDLDHFRAAEPPPPRGSAPCFLMIGRLLRDKGVFEYVEAARQVKQRWPEARFRLLGAVGAANRTAIDRETVEAWHREGIVEYLGTADDVRPLIAEADCVVLPSYREGAPRTLIEAAAMARPVIATDVPGCRAVVDDKVTGLLCAPRSAECLSQALLEFLDLPAARRVAMGQAGRRKMEQEFDQDLVIEAYRSALTQLEARNGYAAAGR